MFSINRHAKTFQTLASSCTDLLFHQKRTYVDVYMRWKRDPYLDNIEHILRSSQLKSIIALKNCIVQDPNACIPISLVSKKMRQFDVSTKVTKFLRQYPSIFEEFVGPEYNLPWFKLTPEATELNKQEKLIYQNSADDLRDRLRKLILMSKNKKNAMKKGVYSLDKPLEFPLFPSKGCRLRFKIEEWLKEFQKLPYISPYDDYSGLDTSSDVAEKRVIGFLHELLCLFVENSAERKKLLCLKKHFGLPQKVHKAFERHPQIFYLSMKNKTCTAILREAYREKGSVETHPVLGVRKKYIELMKNSEVILKSRRRSSYGFVDNGIVEKDLDLDLDFEV